MARVQLEPNIRKADVHGHVARAFRILGSQKVHRTRQTIAKRTGDGLLHGLAHLLWKIITQNNIRTTHFQRPPPHQPSATFQLNSQSLQREIIKQEVAGVNHALEYAFEVCGERFCR